MKREKWMLGEIENWEKESIISSETAAMLSERYTPKRNINFLILLFSIIGAILIGTGIILIGAKNWYQLPLFLRVAIAFFPLIVSQALSIFVLKFKSESPAWREPVAILNTASIFTVIAMTGQIFHISGDFGSYVLTCGILSLPIIYILDAASPLLVYYWTILNWAALNNEPIKALILLGLFALGALFVVIKRKQNGNRLTYITWITVLAGFPLVLFLGKLTSTSLLMVVLSYFVLLISVTDLPENLIIPFKWIGTVGSMITLSILTYQEMWGKYTYEGVTIGSSIMFGVMLLAILYFAARAFKKDKLNFAFIIILTMVCALRYVWITANLDKWPFDFIFMIISNIVLFFVGVGYIVHGTKNINLLTTNIGMAATCALIVMRFFDSEMDFLWRGIVFLILGIAFLLVNLRILHIKKQTKEVEA